MDNVFALFDKVAEVATYKDTPILKEIASGLDAVENNTFRYNAYCFLADKYADMGRFSLSASYREKAILVAKDMKTLPKDLLNVFTLYLKDCNYYVDNDCKEIYEIVLKLLPKDKVNAAYNHRMKIRRNFKNDPVEATREYLEVIDLVEEKIEKNQTHHGFGECFEIWNLKEKYLLEEGIIWRSPAFLNPRIRFD